MFVPHDHGGDPGQHVITGEEDPRPRVTQTYMGRLMPWGVNHLQRPTIADIDPLTVGHRMIRRID